VISDDNFIANVILLDAPDKEFSKSVNGWWNSETRLVTFFGHPIYPVYC